MINITNLSLSLGEKLVVSNLSTQFRKNSFSCILGPNGAGKSSLLKCLAGIHLDWRGEIILEEQGLRGMSASARAAKVAYVPQFLEGTCPYSVEEFLLISRYSSLALSSPEENELIDEVLQQCEVLELRFQRVDTLSGGEKQRVLLAAALAQQAPILLLDEVTASLDPRHHDDIEKLLLKLCREQQKTIIWVTHDINSALRCADEILGVKEGKVIFCKKPAELLQTQALQSLFEREFALVEHPLTGQMQVL